MRENPGQDKAFRIDHPKRAGQKVSKTILDQPGDSGGSCRSGRPLCLPGRRRHQGVSATRDATDVPGQSDSGEQHEGCPYVVKVIVLGIGLGAGISAAIHGFCLVGVFVSKYGEVLR